MASTPRTRRPLGLALAVATLAVLAVWEPEGSTADTIRLKNGTVYRGTVDRDNALVYVSDGLKRVVFFYGSRVDRIDPDAGTSKFEYFSIGQPLDVHGGVQPNTVFNVQATPWDLKGRRTFRFTTVSSTGAQRTVEMQQAINKLGPFATQFRGVDGFFHGQVRTDQIPKPVVMHLLGLVRGGQDERLKVTRWLIDAGYYAEAIESLDALVKDFPGDSGLRERANDTKKLVKELQVRQALEEIALNRKGLQPNTVTARLKALPTDGLPRDVVDDIRDQIRKDDDRAVADRLLGDSLRDLADKLSESDRKAWKTRVAEVLEVLAHAPDAARSRLETLSKADPAAPAEARFALAMSGWLVGADAAVASPQAASDLWRARDVIHDYLASRNESTRPILLEDLQKVAGLDIDKVARIVGRMAPPLRDPDPSKEQPGVVTIHRVIEDDNPEPSEYALLLPPEYQPWRSYPAVVALHDGRGPGSAVGWVAEEAARRGYIVIAPEYTVTGQPRAYRYTAGEHAAVVLSLRDAKKRYAIDSDRVYLAGQLGGGDMAWDFGLAHPDLFAGVVTISGLPGKYVWKYHLAQGDDLPFYIALGEMAPGAREVVYDQLVKTLILKVMDVTYIDYFKRGQEELPEEVPSFFDWMERRRRDPYPKSFKAETAREGDYRFFGVVAQEIAQGRVTAPEAADGMGRNLHPAKITMKAIALPNRIDVTTDGINRVDLWIPPRLIDLSKKYEIRLNGKAVLKGPVPLGYRDLLEDLRIRGDRQQLYYLKVSAGGTPGRGR